MVPCLTEKGQTLYNYGQCPLKMENNEKHILMDLDMFKIWDQLATVRGTQVKP